jgi:F0F1-type ATP synthase assembly protein I
VQTPITGVEATGDAGQVAKAKLEELAVKVALLEAAIFIPKPPGMGHNRGPGLEGHENDEEEIKLFIARLKDERANIAESPDLAQEIQRAKQGIKLHSEFAKGLAKGAGFVVGKDLVERLAESAWWMSVYERLLDVAKALLDILL